MTDRVLVVVGNLTSFVERVIKKLTLDITANLIEDTPVDTGWAKSNWVPSIGEPHPVDQDENMTRGDKVVEVPFARQEQDTGIASIPSYRLSDGPTNITSGVPYIELLNAGHSEQAEAQYVEHAIDRAIQEL